MTPNYDDRKFAFHGDTSGVAGALKRIPDLPIITVAEDTKSISVLPKTNRPRHPNAPAGKKTGCAGMTTDRFYFCTNDFRERELPSLKATQADANNFDGWVNIGRVRTQEGDTAGRSQFLDKALFTEAEFGASQLFLCARSEEEGKYDQAIAKLQSVLQQYSRDRVVRNELGPFYFLQRNILMRRKNLKLRLSIDPETCRPTTI